MSGPLLTHFAHFGSKRFIFKKSGCHAHHHHTTDFAEFQKKNNEPIPRKLLDGRADRP